MRRFPLRGVVALAALATGVAVGFVGSGLISPESTSSTPAAPTAPLVLAASPTPSAGVVATSSPSASPSGLPSPTPTLSPTPTPYDGPLTRKVPVLNYHLVGDPPPGEPYPSLFVSVADFTAQMQALKDGGWRTITAAELGAAMAADRPVPARSIVLTFDDGDLSNFTTAFPILQGFGFRATFFVVAAGGGGRMTPEQLGIMAQAGMEIANHTLNHANVSRLSTASLDTQIAGAELRIETELAAQGVVAQVRTFAYPSGHVSATAVAYLAGRHYTAAFTTVSGIASIGTTDPLQVPRLRVSRSTTLAAFLAMLPAEPVP